MFVARKGKITQLRVNDGSGHSWGGNGDILYTDVVVVLNNNKREAFGIDIKNAGDDLAAKLSMLSALKDAMMNDMTVVLGINLDEGRNNGILIRVDVLNE